MHEVMLIFIREGEERRASVAQVTGSSDGQTKFHFC